MISSPDNNDVAALKNISAVFNFLNNPDQYRKILTDINATLGSMQDTVKMYKSVEEFEKFKVGETARLGKLAEDLEKEQDANISSNKNTQAKLLARETELIELGNAASADRAEANNVLSAAKAQVLELSQRDAKLLKAENDLYQRQVDLKVAEGEVAEKLEKLNNALKSM